jgi:hypothetical protein
MYDSGIKKEDSQIDCQINVSKQSIEKTTFAPVFGLLNKDRRNIVINEKLPTSGGIE